MNFKIKQANSIEQVFNSAYWHLAQRDLSIPELLKKLQAKTNNEAWINTVISDCFEKGYLKSDLDFAKHFIRISAENQYKGPAWIKQKLSQKGISSQLIEEALDESNLDFKTILSSYINTKYAESFWGKDKNKITQLLVNRGFSFSDVSEAISNHKLADELNNVEQDNKKKLKPVDREILNLFKNGKGARYIQQNLKSKGYPSNEINKVLLELELDFYHSCLELMIKLIDKKRLDMNDYSTKQKLKASLVNKGFDFDEINFAIDEVSSS